MSRPDFGTTLRPGRARVGALATAGAATVAPAEVPVALLPVGLETRFRDDSLLVRVIPDEVHVMDHEPGLTEGEVTAGRAFWRSVWRGGTAEPAATEAERAAWVTLAGAVGNPRRSAYVANQTAPPPGGRPADPVPDGQPLPEPAFPSPAVQDSAWTRSAMAGSLPDAFVAIAYRREGTGGTATWTELGRAWGKPVSEAIQLGLDPSAAPPVSDDGPALPDGMKWMVDPAATDAAGLLVTVPLPPGTTQVDRLVVLGVAQSVDAPAAAGRLADLLAGHHYSRGLELLEVGTPTNNTTATRSGYARRNDPAASFAVERRTPGPADGTDGALLAGALGVPAATFEGVGNAGATALAMAGQLNALVWPSAFGYWLDTLVQPGPDDRTIEDIRDHAVAMVRGRGPLPLLRVGRQPYGVLPVTSLRAWKRATEPPAVGQVAQLLRTAMSWWQSGVGRTPVVRAGQDPAQGMLDVLGQAAVSTTTGVRSMVGAHVSYIPNQIVLPDGGAQGLAAEGNRQRWLALLGTRALGFPGLPYVGQLVASADPVPLLHLPYTTDRSASPADQDAAWSQITAYLRGLRGRPTADLRAENPRVFTSLVTLLAHRSVMLERVRIGVRDTIGTVAGQLVEAHLRVADSPAVEAGLVATTATLRIGDTRSAIGTVLSGSVRRADGTRVALPDYLDGILVGTAIDPVGHRDYAATLDAAEAVAGLDPDLAGLLLGEALDVASHRLDAWVTSLATRRLSDLRAATPSGVTLGAYGVVEELSRAPARPAVTEVPDGAPARLSADLGGAGYVHAPSLAQAATAAVLRSGHLSHADRDAGSAALAVDLSSSRVRVARGLLDGVREGQPLGALLGYRVERQLHDLGAHTAVEVVRRLAPPPVVTAGGSPEGMPPRAVCDGLALSRLDRAGVLSAVTAAGSRPDAVATALDALDDAVDALADLLLAEGVHQVVTGNPDRAAAALDALNRGDGAIPDPAVVRTPRTGTSLTHRVLVLIGPDAQPAPGWPVDGMRAVADPLLAAWAGHLLGDPAGIHVTVTSPEPEDPGAPAAPAPVVLTLGDLGAGALDVVYEFLVPRILRHARSRGAAENATVDLTSGPVAAMLATADLLNALLVRARAGTGVDLARPQDRGAVVSGPPGDPASTPFKTDVEDVDHGARAQRLAAARGLLSAAITALAAVPVGIVPDEAALTPHLDTLAALGLHPGTDPGRAMTAEALAGLVTTAQRRLDEATAAAPDDAAGLFGEGFPATALVVPPATAHLDPALAVDPLGATAREALAGLGGRATALDSWLELHGRVRAQLGRLADVLMAARLRGTATGTLRAAQLPVRPFPKAEASRSGSWVGVAFPGALGPEPVTSLVLHTLGTVDLTTGVSVLAIDEFVEVVPSAETTTAVSFGYDAPGARPPQSLLLAVPPVVGRAWTIDGLADVVGETIDLAKVRMVDLSSVAWAGRFVPTIYLTDGDIAHGLDLPVRAILREAYLTAAKAGQA